MIAKIIRISPIGLELTPCENANPITKALPIRENNQKIGLGFSLPMNTANIAVDRGNIPINTNECAEVMYSNAIAVNRGKPITPPMATLISGHICSLVGRFSRRAITQASANKAAITALAAVAKIGSRSLTAILVAGIEPANRSTPINPFNHPLDDFVVAFKMPDCSIILFYLGQNYLYV